MTAHTPHSSHCRIRRKTGAAWLLVAVTFLTLAPLQSSVAQVPGKRTIIRTIIPSEVVTLDSPQPEKIFFTTEKQVLLRFQKDSLPEGETVEEATLELVSQDNPNLKGDGELTVKLVTGEKWTKEDLRKKKKSEGLLFGYQQFDKNTPPDGQRVRFSPTQVPTSLKSETSFGLLLFPTGKSGRQWHSLLAASNYKPRLILKSTVSHKPAVVQAEGVPWTHSKRAFLPTLDGTKWLQVSVRDVWTTGVWSHEPVFANDLVYLITWTAQTQGPKLFELQALSPLGGAPVWSVPLTNPGKHLVLSDSGRLYIVGKGENKKNPPPGRLLIYKLNPQNPSEKATREDKPSPVMPSDLNPVAAPAVGPDGSLYFVNLTNVYGFNPALQELWQVPLDPKHKTSSRVTVGPSGQFVYLIGQAEGEQEMGLIAIDAQNGVSSTKPLPKIEPNNPEKTILHAPVVLLKDDGIEKIYVAANSQIGGVLACFDKEPKKTEDGGIGKLMQAEKWPSLEEKEGGFSQPTASTIVGDKKNWNIYSVKVTGKKKEGQLMAVNWLEEGDKVDSVGQPFLVGDLPYLLNRGNLAVDGDGNVLVWNGGLKDESTLDAFTPTTFHFHPKLNGPAKEARLLFGTDATLYAVNDGSGELRAIVPQYTLSAASSATISSPTHLRVNGTVGKTTVLKAAGSVLLGPKFTVQEGATLKIATGTP